MASRNVVCFLRFCHRDVRSLPCHLEEGKSMDLILLGKTARLLRKIIKFTAVIATTQKVAVVSPLCSSLPSVSLAGFI